MSFLSKVGDALRRDISKSVAQVNPLDNGRTFKHNAPTNNRSIAGQVTHNAVTNVAGGFVKAPIQFANTGNLAAHNVYDTVRMMAANATHNPAAFTHANQAAQNTYNHFAAPNSGLFHQGTFLKDANQAQHGSARDIATRVGGGTLQTAATIAPFAKGGSFALKGLTAKQIVPRLAVEGGAYNGAFNAGQQLQNTGHINPKELATNIGIGAVAGPALYGAGKFAPTVIKGISKAPAAVKTLAQENPSVKAIRDTNTQLQQKYENITSVQARKQLSQQIAKNNQDIVKIKQGGYIKVPGAGDSKKPLGSPSSQPPRANSEQLSGRTTSDRGLPVDSLPTIIAPDAESRVFAQNPMLPSSGYSGIGSAVHPASSAGLLEPLERLLQSRSAQSISNSLDGSYGGTIPLPELKGKSAMGKPLRTGLAGTLQGAKDNLDLAFKSTRSIIEHQGEHGKALAGMLQKARDTEEIYQGNLAKRLQTVRSLKGADFENFVEATQGLAKAKNDKIIRAIGEWRSVHPEIRNRAVSAGLDVGNLGSTYYPHFIDYNEVFKNTNTYNKAINHLVKTGQAANEGEAMKLLSYAAQTSRNRSFGNLEASRVIDLPMYDKTPNSLTSYLGGSTKRIAAAETFGKQDEKALELITEAGKQGFDTETMKNAYDIAVGAKKYGQKATSMSNKLRAYQSTTRLGLGAITNATQNVNTGIVTGHLRTMAAMIKQLDPKTRSFVEDTGAISDAVLNELKSQAGFVGKTLGKITAPGFASVEKFNRSVAATAGRDYGLRLAQKGDESTLRRLGVTGPIKNKTLTEAQQIQVARKVVEKTQFKVDAQDLPGWADSPGGKLVSQFRTFSYAQAKFFSNEILKPAAKGNLMPMGRLLAALPVGYAVYETKRKIAGRPEEDNKARRGIEVFGNIGGAGIAVDIFRGLVPLNGKYLTPDRFTSMAAGTIGGPTLGAGVDAAGALVQSVQKKNLPSSKDELNGKAAIVHGDGYYDATTAARFGLRQIPIVGTAIQNRVLPYAPKTGLHKDQQAFYDQITDPAKKADYKKTQLAANEAELNTKKQDNVNKFYGKTSGSSSSSSSYKAQSQIKGSEQQKGIFKVKAKDGSQKYTTLQGKNLKSYSSLDEAKAAQQKNIFKYSKEKTTTINGQQYHKTTSGTVVKGAPPAPKAPTTANVTYDPKTATWTKVTPTTGKTVRIDSTGAQTVLTPGIGRISNARPDYQTNILTMAKKYNVDPYAAMAVAATEGLGGGVGDGGHAFGPFQLNDAGGVITGKFRSPQEAQAWAESPEGIEFAMQRISQVAGGKKGEDAINAIVHGFERPADPYGEVAKAVAIYGGRSASLTSGSARTYKIASTKGSSGSSKSGSSKSGGKGKVASFKTPTPRTFKLPKVSTSDAPKYRVAKAKQQKSTGKIAKAKAIKVRYS